MLLPFTPPGVPIVVAVLGCLVGLRRDGLDRGRGRRGWDHRVEGFGPALLGTRQLPELVADLAVLLALTLLGALVVTQTLGGPDGLEVDARLIVVVVLAAAVTAVTRALV